MNILRYELTDDKIKMAIEDLFANSKNLDAREIRIDVEDGDVILSGSVASSTQRDYAIALLNLIQGINDVQSKLVVKSGKRRSPIEVLKSPEEGQ